MIRHGQSVGNRDGYFTGTIDVALTDEGIAQAQAAHDALENHENKPDIVIHSALSRAKHTAQIVNQTLQLDMIEISELNEQNFGDWEGQSVQHFREFYLSGKTPENGESFPDFNNRIQTVISEILNVYENPIIVCHGGVFRAFHSLYDMKQERTENAIIHHFAPSPSNRDFPWDIQAIR